MAGGEVATAGEEIVGDALRDTAHRAQRGIDGANPGEEAVEANMAAAQLRQDATLAAGQSAVGFRSVASRWRGVDGPLISAALRGGLPLRLPLRLNKLLVASQEDRALHPQGMERGEGSGGENRRDRGLVAFGSERRVVARLATRVFQRSTVSIWGPNDPHTQGGPSATRNRVEPRQEKASERVVGLGGESGSSCAVRDEEAGAGDARATHDRAQPQGQRRERAVVYLPITGKPEGRTHRDPPAVTSCCYCCCAHVVARRAPMHEHDGVPARQCCGHLGGGLLLGGPHNHL